MYDGAAAAECRGFADGDGGARSPCSDGGTAPAGRMEGVYRIQLSQTSGILLIVIPGPAVGSCGVKPASGVKPPAWERAPTASRRWSGAGHTSTSLLSRGGARTQAAKSTADVTCSLRPVFSPYGSQMDLPLLVNRAHASGKHGRFTPLLAMGAQYAMKDRSPPYALTRPPATPDESGSRGGGKLTYNKRARGCGYVTSSSQSQPVLRAPPQLLPMKHLEGRRNVNSETHSLAHSLAGSFRRMRQLNEEVLEPLAPRHTLDGTAQTSPSLSMMDSEMATQSIALTPKSIMSMKSGGKRKERTPVSAETKKAKKEMNQRDNSTESQHTHEPVEDQVPGWKEVRKKRELHFMLLIIWSTAPPSKSVALLWHHYTPRIQVQLRLDAQNAFGALGAAQSVMIIQRTYCTMVSNKAKHNQLSIKQKCVIFDGLEKGETAIKLSMEYSADLRSKFAFHVEAPPFMWVWGEISVGVMRVDCLSLLRDGLARINARKKAMSFPCLRNTGLLGSCFSTLDDVEGSCRFRRINSNCNIDILLLLPKSSEYANNDIGLFVGNSTINNVEDKEMLVLNRIMDSQEQSNTSEVPKENGEQLDTNEPVVENMVLGADVYVVKSASILGQIQERGRAAILGGFLEVLVPLLRSRPDADKKPSFSGSVKENPNWLGVTSGKNSAPDNELQSTESAANDVDRRESMFQNKKDLFPLSSPHHVGFSYYIFAGPLGRNIESCWTPSAPLDYSALSSRRLIHWINVGLQFGEMDPRDRNKLLK
uniref:Uncharacterized protein n=1 Tax=Timema douglasi TaxID=61478 RepID=A0A7R8VI71_TIMDO|nr:unnamed protein product [Timema douglasi]